MNKAITDGLALMPPPFAAGLSQWSSGDGTPGSDNRMGGTPLLPGLFLRVTARMKRIDGALLRVEVEQGDKTQFRLGFGVPVKGAVRAVVRMDNPL